jgi:hypothetical protein
VIGQGKKANVTLPRGGGIALSPIEERDQKAVKSRSKKTKSMEVV